MEIGTKPIPISVLTAVTNSALNAASVFPSRRIEISDSHTDLNRSADTCRSRPAGFGRPGRGRLDGHDLRRATLACLRLRPVLACADCLPTAARRALNLSVHALFMGHKAHRTPR